MAPQKEQFRENNAPKRISHVQFGLFSASDMRKVSNLPIFSKDLYQTTDRQPYPHGALDRRLGTSDKKSTCQTCGLKLQDCIGHFGHIQLELPVFHIGFFKATLAVLQKICKTCARVLLTEDDIYSLGLRFAAIRNESLQRRALNKLVSEKTKKVSVCPHCAARNGPVKKVGALKIIHEKYNQKKDKDPEVGFFRDRFAKAQPAVKDLDALLASNRVQEDLTALKVWELFKKIPDSDCRTLDIDPSTGRPESLILTHMLVPPVCIRPSVAMDGSAGSNEDDLTMLLSEIVFVNTVIAKHAATGAGAELIFEDWEFMQLKCALYINSEMTGLPPSMAQQKPTRGFCQRLKGKQGRFRGNLSGKRVDFSSRSVISPDPNLAINEVGVPKYVAKILSFPEMVNDINIERMRQLVKNGPNQHPGANYIEFCKGKKRFQLSYGNRNQLAKNLKPGDIVERHIVDGDTVLFNRQPSLHRVSIMSHKVRVLPWRTFRFNECVCSPYNADFDGDEMNLHVPQTEEARAEAQILMETTYNVCTPRNGEPLIAATQDFITGGYLLTSRDRFLTIVEISQLAAGMGDGALLTRLPPPCILRPMKLWSGKQLISVLLRANEKVSTVINMQAENRNYSKKYLPPSLYHGSFEPCPKVQGSGRGFFKLTLVNAKRMDFEYDIKGINRDKAKLQFVLKPEDEPEEVMYETELDSTNRGKWVGSWGEGSDTCTQEVPLAAVEALPRSELHVRICTAAHPFGELECLIKVQPQEDGKIPEKIKIGHFCSEDGYVVIRNSQLLCGQLDKSILGDSGKNTMFYWLMRDVSEEEACMSMGRIAKLTALFLQSYGFSIGIGDVTPSNDLLRFKDELIRKGYSACERYIQQLQANTLETQAGCSPEETLESVITKELSDIREAAGLMCRKELPRSNAPLIMARCGSKGSNINMSQMIACVGQQTISGNRMPNGFEDRSLPHFLRNEKVPAAKGFVANSFFTGLTPTEFFFHTMGGREGLVDTAVKTAETGYMQRRLIKALEDLSSMYDTTVRNSSGTMIQFCYGEDGLDPACIEGGHEPVNLSHLLEHTLHTVSSEGASLLPYEVIEQSEVKLQSSMFDEIRHSCKEPDADEHFFIKELRDFMLDLATRLATLRSHWGLSPNLTKEASKKRKATENVVDVNAVDKILKITTEQLEKFFHRALFKYEKAMIEPGSAVGAVGAQSIGEPGTQMTLKTFHFAGVAAMNVTLGVPRIKEIINASKLISTPIIRAALEAPKSLPSTRIVKGRMEKTLLGQVSRFVDEVYSKHSSEPFLVIKLDVGLIKELFLEIDARTVKRSILAAPKLKLKPMHVDIVNESSIKVFPPDKTGGMMQALKVALPKVIVKGIPSVTRAIVSIEDGDYQLLVEGEDLRAVMTTQGVIGTRTTSNHIIDVEHTLGIEAARYTIMHEITYTMREHGLVIDNRHVMLLADLMTFKGEVLGITRFGIAKMKESVFMLASFEKTTDHLFDAALHGTKDPISGVSECIIVGVPMGIGTGMFQVLHDRSRTEAPKKLEKRKMLFDVDDLHIPLERKRKPSVKKVGE